MNEGTHLFQSQVSTYINPVYKAHKDFESGFLKIGQSWMCVVLSSFIILSDVPVVKLSSLSSELSLLDFSF